MYVLPMCLCMQGSTHLCSGWQCSQALVNLGQQVLKLSPSDGGIITQLIQRPCRLRIDLCSDQAPKSLGSILAAVTCNMPHLTQGC